MCDLLAFDRAWARARTSGSPIVRCLYGSMLKWLTGTEPARCCCCCCCCCESGDAALSPATPIAGGESKALRVGESSASVVVATVRVETGGERALLAAAALSIRAAFSSISCF